MVLSACAWQHRGGPSSAVAWPLSVALTRALTGLHARCLRSTMSSLSFAPSLLSLWFQADSPEASTWRVQLFKLLYC